MEFRLSWILSSMIFWIATKKLSNPQNPQLMKTIFPSSIFILIRIRTIYSSNYSSLPKRKRRKLLFNLKKSCIALKENKWKLNNRTFDILQTELQRWPVVYQFTNFLKELRIFAKYLLINFKNIWNQNYYWILHQEKINNREREIEIGIENVKETEKMEEQFEINLLQILDYCKNNIHFLLKIIIHQDQNLQEK